MPLNRRQFLTSAGLGALGLGFVLVEHNLRWPGGKSAANPPANQDMQLVQGPGGGVPRLRFVTIGDTGTGDRGQYQVAQAMERYWREQPYSLVLMAGDNIYGNRSVQDGSLTRIQEVFERPYGPLLAEGVKFYACLGNHDIVTHNGEDSIRYPGFNMQERYYSFTAAETQFFVLDTNPGPHFEDQIVWLDGALAQSLTPWKVVLGHHPLYSSGQHGSSTRMSESLGPILNRHAVRLYLCGHDHNYERTVPMAGTTHIICGNGARLRPVSYSSITACAASQLGFVIFDVFDQEIQIRAVSPDGLVFDQAGVSLEAVTTRHQSSTNAA